MSEGPYFYSFLANVDSNILNLKLDYGFKVEEISVAEYQKFISKFVGTLDNKLGLLSNVLYPKHSIVQKGKIYYIKGLTEILKEEDARYIINLIAKLRLFKEGFITIPVNIGYGYISDGKLTKADNILIRIGLSVTENKYYISKEEVDILNKFIHEIELPFKEKYLQLALDNLQESIIPKKQELLFLYSMIGFEALFNKGKDQITHTISRHTAIITGKRPGKFHKIYKEMKSYYDIRSKLVHGISNTKINNEVILRLRYLLRECIKEIYKLNLNKDDLFEYLNEKGF